MGKLWLQWVLDLTVQRQWTVRRRSVLRRGHRRPVSVGHNWMLVVMFDKTQTFGFRQSFVCNNLYIFIHLIFVSGLSFSFFFNTQIKDYHLFSQPQCFSIDVLQSETVPSGSGSSGSSGTAHFLLVGSVMFVLCYFPSFIYALQSRRLLLPTLYFRLQQKLILYSVNHN